jgi:hypothetical protein
MISNNLYVIAAICGNFFQESTVNPGIWEGLTPGNPGYGLGQWTDNPPQVMRRTALFNWLSANGYSQDSGPGQLAFLVYEDLWIPSLFQQSAYNTLSDFFASTSTNLSDLTLEWMYHWEGIDDGTFGIRYSAAQHFLSAFQNDDGSRLPWFTGNYYLSRDYGSTDNALLIMDFFLGETPPEPPDPGDPTAEELIAMLTLAKKKKMKGGIWISW